MRILISTFVFQHFYTGRLEKELHGLLPPSVSNGITVIPPPFGADTAWFGAKQISNVSSINVFACAIQTSKIAHISISKHPWEKPLFESHIGLVGYE